MASASEAMTTRPPRASDRLASGFLLVLMALGTLALWIGIPIAGLWGLSKVTDSIGTHFLAALVVIPTAIVLFAVALTWLNRLYLRVRRASRPEDERPWAIRGPLDFFMRWSLLLAGIAFLAWFFILAENPSSCSGWR